MTHTQA